MLSARTPAQKTKVCKVTAHGEDYYFNLAKKLTQTESNCAKIQTGAVIVKNGKVVGEGFNLCSPVGFKHGETVEKCLRMEVPSGQGYELCKGVHAEVVAIVDAGAQNCKDAIMYLCGHYYPCWHCESLARISGIKEIKVQDVSAKRFYEQKKR